jgi:integrase/recombinase XerD
MSGLCSLQTHCVFPAQGTKITKWVYAHRLRYSVARTLLERGMPLEQTQKFLGYPQLETTQMYAESMPEMIKVRDQKALSG